RCKLEAGTVSIGGDLAPHLLDARASRFLLQPPFNRASGGLCLFARLRRWLGCLGDKGDKAGASVGAVLLLRAITAGFDDDDAILGGTLPRKGDRSLPHPLGEVWGIRRIKAQLDSSGD